MAVLFQKVFPFVPKHTDWQTFTGNIMMYYGQELIPITDEIDWKISARNIIQTPTFSRYNIPDPERYLTWEEWAQEFVLLINGKPHN